MRVKTRREREKNGYLRKLVLVKASHFCFSSLNVKTSYISSIQKKSAEVFFFIIYLHTSYFGICMWHSFSLFCNWDLFILIFCLDIFFGFWLNGCLICLSLLIYANETLSLQEYIIFFVDLMNKSCTTYQYWVSQIFFLFLVFISFFCVFIHYF